MASAKKNNKPATSVNKKKNGAPRNGAPRNGAPRSKTSAHGKDDLSLVPTSGDLVRRFRDEVNHLIGKLGFDDLTNSLPSAESLGLGFWTPQVEVFERAGQIVVRADLPGLGKDDIKLDISDSAITIDGHRTHEHEESQQGYFRSERSYGSFHRRIPLPRGVEVNTAKAQFRNGVLEITVATPTVGERQGRTLEIEGEPTPARARAASG